MAGLKTLRRLNETGVLKTMPPDGVTDQQIVEALCSQGVTFRLGKGRMLWSTL